MNDAPDAPPTPQAAPAPAGSNKLVPILVAAVAVLSLTTILLAAALVANSGEDDQEPRADDKSPSKPLFEEYTVEPSEDESAGFVEPNIGDRALTVGDAREGRTIATTLHELRYPMPPDEYREADEGNVWIGLRIEQCLDEAESEQVPGSYNGEWSVVTPTGEEYAGNGSSWSDWPSPKYPENSSLIPGRCLKGWLALQVPEGTKIASVMYRSEGTAVAEWLPE